MTFDPIANSRILTCAFMLLGLWPTIISSDGSWFQRYYRWYQLSLHVPLTFTFLVLMSLEVLFSESLEHATEVLKFCLTEMGLVVKVFNIWYYSRKAAGLLHQWETGELSVLETVGEQDMWRRAQRAFHKVLIVYVGCSFNTSLFALIGAPFTNPGELPFSFWMPRKWHENYHWPIYAYESIAMPFTCLCNTLSDLFLSYFMLHLTLCIRVIGKRLERLNNIEDDEAITKQLTKLIKMHWRVVDMSKQCEQIISLPLLIQIIINSFVICFTVYRLQSISITENTAVYLAMFQYIVSISMQIFLPSYYANELTVQSQNLIYHLYSCDWTRMSAYNRRMVFLYMEYLKQPIILRAGNFFEIGLPIFSKTMNNAYSLLALLLNVSDDNK